ncbi:P-loop containing nucleoside triphosphate hydrolase protein [Dichotomocladium elegans]|nr:P-loop containing nucleoside triphosphate hydrolase protein [Dichotomocladium elegans]
MAGSELSGTGYIFNTLRSHPQVVGTVDHQDSSALFEADDEALFEAYLDEFPLLQTDAQVDKELVVGEHAPQYLYRSHVSAQRLRELLPHVKLVFILRDPIDRAYAQYLLEAETELDILRQCGHTTTEWGGFVRCHESNEIKVFREAPFDATYQGNQVGLDSLARGMYYSALLPFLDRFPASQLLVMRTEDFLGDPSTSFQRLARFLGINPAFFSERSFYRGNRLAESVLFGHDVIPPPIHFHDSSSRVHGKVSALALEDGFIRDHMQLQTTRHRLSNWPPIPRLDLGIRYRLQKVFRQLNTRLIELFEHGAEDFAGWEYDVEQG